MARPLRVNLPDGWYHCMHRGIERRTIYQNDRDFYHFLELLGETTERFRFVIHAYCLLDNHYHAIIQTPDANLSQGMQWLGLSYSSWFNAKTIGLAPSSRGALRASQFKMLPGLTNSAATCTSTPSGLGNSVWTAITGMRRRKAFALPPLRSKLLRV